MRPSIAVVKWKKISTSTLFVFCYAIKLGMSPHQMPIRYHRVLSTVVDSSKAMEFLVRSDDQFGDEFTRQGVEIVPVKGRRRAVSQVLIYAMSVLTSMIVLGLSHTVAVYVLANFGQSNTHGVVGIELRVVLLAVPLTQSWQLLRDGGEEADDDTHGRGLHVGAEFVDDLLVLKEMLVGQRDPIGCLDSQVSDIGNRIAFPPKRQVKS